MKKLIRFIGNTAASTTFVTAYLTFIAIYSGKFDVIDVNSCGEGIFELIFLTIALPAVIYTFFYNIKHLK